MGFFRQFAGHRPRHVAEYLLLRGFAAAVNALPYRAALGLAWFLAALAHYIGRFRVRTARERLREVFGERLSRRAVRRTAWLAWRNFIFSVVEMLRRRGMTLDWIRARAECSTAEALVAAHARDGRGGVLAIPHLGSWEMGGAFLQVAGLTLVQVVARQKNPLVNRYWHHLRSVEASEETVERGGAGLLRIVRRLKVGEFMAILPDVRVREPGIVVPMLGRTANIGPGMATLARLAGVPIYPCICVRRGWTRHDFRALPPIHSDPALERHADVERMTRQVLKIVEEAILAHPDQWFWFNKRWLLDPLEPRA